MVERCQGKYCHLFLSRTCCVTWGKSLALSEPPLPDLCPLKRSDHMASLLLSSSISCSIFLNRGKFSPAVLGEFWDCAWDNRTCPQGGKSWPKELTPPSHAASQHYQKRSLTYVQYGFLMSFYTVFPFSLRPPARIGRCLQSVGQKPRFAWGHITCGSGPGFKIQIFGSWFLHLLSWSFWASVYSSGKWG